APARYTWSRRADDTGFGGQVRATALARLLRDGATLVVQSLQHNYRPVADFCARLEHETGQVLFAEAFLTPGDRPGLEAHHDEENVLIVQTVGSKTWRLHRPMVEQPLQHETYGSLGLDAAAKQRIADTEPDLDVTLRPGDVLWVPRGWLHRGQATGTTSLHITFGFPVLTRFWLAQRITRELARQGAAFGPLRQELPWNTATHRRRLTAACGDVVQDVRDALGHLDPAELAAAFADEHLRGRTQPDASVPVTAGLQPDVELHTPVRLVREAVRGTVSPPDGGLRLYLRDQSVVLQGPVVPWLERHLGREDDAPVTAAELVPELEA
ncbi:cupin domain-containing protein, partial [Streptomyces sp. SID4917]|uniref:JmjC domain-containing protein n=1 Tax=Streptomyces sp. SID4917 TaxID=2690269 RepID=UPI0013697561